MLVLNMSFCRPYICIADHLPLRCSNRIPIIAYQSASDLNVGHLAHSADVWAEGRANTLKATCRAIVVFCIHRNGVVLVSRSARLATLSRKFSSEKGYFFICLKLYLRLRRLHQGNITEIFIPAKSLNYQLLLDTVSFSLNIIKPSGWIMYIACNITDRQFETLRNL